MCTQEAEGEWYPLKWERGGGDNKSQQGKNNGSNS